MDDTFKIYIEQLRNGHIEEIDEKFPSDFLDVHESDLSFKGDVIVQGKAYLAEDMLILNFDVSASAVLPCSICNEPIEIKKEIAGYYHAEPLTDIKGGIFSFKEILREIILLDTPKFAECEGSCPRRKEISQYLKKPAKNEFSKEEEGYHPFADFDWDKTKKKK